MNKQSKEPVFEIIFESDVKEEAVAKELENIILYSKLGLLFNNKGNPSKVDRELIKTVNTEYIEAVKNISKILAKSIAKKHGITTHFIKQIKINQL